MSVYIPGMEMPTSCNDCIFDTWGLCLINANLEGKDEFTHSCPLVHVPEHGRLIDADACAEYFENQAQNEWNKNAGTTWRNAYLSLGAYIEEDAPTIIPADKEGE